MTRKRSEEKGRVLRLEEITHSRLQSLDRERTLVAAAVSPIEVHGPHLPLGQDLLEAFALTEKTLEKVASIHKDWTFVLLPPIPIATDCVPKMGSINFPVTLVQEMAYHLLRPFALHGFSRLVYTSFHGGPRHNLALEAAAHRLNREYNTAVLSVLSVVISKAMEGNLFFNGVEHTQGRKISLEEAKKDLHAGYVETSIGLHLWPELVEEGWKDLPGLTSTVSTMGKDSNQHFLYGYATPAGLTERVQQMLARVQAMARSAGHFRKHTYRGFPAMSSAEEGRDLFEHLVGISREVILDFIEQGREMDGHSPLWPFRKILLNPAVNKVFDDWMGVYTE